MRVTLFLLSALLTAAAANAQTEIYDMEDVSGTWTKANSPYIVLGEAIVPDGQTLTIEPGVEVRFATSEERDYSSDDFEMGILRVFGTLKAVGSQTDPILFTRDGRRGQWGCIHIQSGNKKSLIKWCIVEYSHYIQGLVFDPDDESTDNSTGAISFYGSGGRVENCVIRNSWAAINAKNGASPVIDHCTIVENEYALESNADGPRGTTKIKASNCILHGNENGFFITESDGVSLAYTFVDEGQWDDNIEDGGNNIKKGKDPLFEDMDDENYKLKKKSPCRKKGADRTNMGAY
jgi:hypothetical protein